MTGLALQIDGKWAVLSEDDSVNIENNSPVWGDGNSFSLPFELDIEANRHILGNSDQITGQSVYEVVDGKRAVLYTLGIPVYYGKIKMDDEVELSEGKVDVTLVSGNLTFDEMIDGMNCQDVEILDRIVIGERVTEFTLSATDGGTNSGSMSGFFPNSFMWPSVDGNSVVNVTNPYPIAKYCNIRICYQIPEKNKEGEDQETGLSSTEMKAIDEIYNPQLYGKYVVLGEDRAMSSPCFYVLYFLDCLFGKLGCDYSHDRISYMEDMRRLAFCSTRCGYDEEDTGESLSYSTIEKYFRVLSYTPNTLTYKWNAPLKRCIANSKNFPNTDVSELVDSLEAGFGIRFLFDEKSNFMDCVYVRDILRDTAVHSIRSVEIHEVSKMENATKGFKLTYTGADDDTNYNYRDWGKNAVLSDEYNYIISQTEANNKNLYLDTRTGNAYRIKIDSEANSSEEKNPALMEVGAYNSATYGDCMDDSFTETVEIGFTPVTMNDVYYKKRRAVIRSSKRGSSRAAGTGDSSTNDQMFALYLDVGMKYPSWVAGISLGFSAGRYTAEAVYTYFEDQRFDESRTDQSKSAYETAKYKERKSVGGYITADAFENNSPIQSYDTGLMLGIMRGPGNDSGVEEFDEDYDGEGNFRYVMTSTNSAFHGDTLDNYARAWDYNGTLDGGVETEGSISLKIRAEKPNPNAMEGDVPFYPISESYAQRRGLFDKFYSEYAYFVVNRKIVRMKCRMEMADLLNIDWTKRYRIGEYVGFINKYSYSVSASGISDVELEMYYL